MQNIVDKVKELTGNDVDYPSKEFTSGFAPYPDPSILLEQEDQNKAGERPGKQSKQRLVRTASNPQPVALALYSSQC